MAAWLWWIVVVLVLAAVEILSLDFIFAMVAMGALAAAVAALLGAPLLLQVIVAAVGSILLLFTVRPIALRALRSTPQARTNVHALIGAQATVLRRVDRFGGLVKIGGEEWTARADADDVVFEAATSVYVARIDGATAVVTGSVPARKPLADDEGRR